MSEQAHYGDYLFDDQWITGLVKRICEERDDAIKRAEAAKSALRLATHSTGSTTVLMTLEQYQELLAADKRAEAAEAKLALVDAYGQYMRNAPKPRTFAEWLEWRESVRA